MFFKSKIAGFVIIVLTLFGCTFAYASGTIETESIRINNIGSLLTVSLSGEAGGSGSVELIEPSVTLPNATVSLDEFVKGLAYVDSFEFNENGQYTFTYTAKTTGVFTFRVRGASAIEFYVENDAPEMVKSESIYVEAWDIFENTYHENYNGRYILSRSNLETLGVKQVAKNVKAHLDTIQPGRRTLFIANDFDPKKYSESLIWWDEATDEVALLLEDFFKEYYNIGGNLDFIYSDFESNVTMWNLTEEQIETITKDGRYKSDLKPRLERAGYKPIHDLFFGELQSILKFTLSENYLCFNRVLVNMSTEYHNKAIYEPAVKWFKNVKYADYGVADAKQYYGSMDASHRIYKPTEMYKKAGTHSVPVLYPEITRGSYFVDLYELADEINGGRNATVSQLQDTDFGELIGSIGKLRIAALSTEGGKIAPYVTGANADLYESGYFSEQILHIGLHDPDPILYFGARLSSSESSATVNMRRNNLLLVLEELNDLVGYSDRVSLNNELPEYTASYCISGMYANGKNIWRITPDTSVVSYKDFLIDAEEPTFVVGDVQITFPGGEIISNSSSTIGYWVSTDSDVKPKIVRLDAKKPEVKLEFIGNDAVVFYRNLANDNYKLYMASYGVDGNLLDVEIRNMDVLSQNGVTAIPNIDKPTDAITYKFMLWNDITPIIPVIVK